MSVKVVLFGDSITQGLGSKKINFHRELESMLGENISVINLALTGTTVDYVLTQMDAVALERPDIAVILYGNVDGQIRPCRTGKIFPRIPGRFGAENGSMIMPRPFYSGNLLKHMIQRGENLLRSCLRKLVYAVDGTEQWVPIDQYISVLNDVCCRLSELGVRPLICSTVFIDDRLFPNSDSEYQKYNARMSAYALSKKIPFVDIYSALKTQVLDQGWKSAYNHDHFHPNGEGYVIMAKQIAEAILIEA